MLALAPAGGSPSAGVLALLARLSLTTLPTPRLCARPPVRPPARPSTRPPP